MTCMNPMLLRRDDEMDRPNSDDDSAGSCCLYYVDGSRVLNTSALCKVVLRSVLKDDIHVCVLPKVRVVTSRS